MGRVRTTRDGYLFLDFYYKEVRCREYTTLADDRKNRKDLENVMRTIDREITSGKFDYLKYFPGGSRAKLFGGNGKAVARAASGRFDFEEFAHRWLLVSRVEWKRSTRKDFESILEKHIMPYFEGSDIRKITKLALKEFRAKLSAREGKKGRTMGNKRINNIMVVLRLILNAASDEFGFPSPFDNLDPLPIAKPEIHPFSLDEVWTFLRGVRKDFHNYYFMRFFTGMRTGEIDGLKWQYIDFEHGKIRVRETWQRGMWDTPKTASSIRDIDMSGPIEEILRRQKEFTGHLETVFANKADGPLDHNLVTKRVWYPTLKKLGLMQRTPYQTRHTAATLWLASGENPEWVARQLGHTNTEMLFKTYSKFIPNLTRRDGSAFERFIRENMDNHKGEHNEDNDREL